MDRGYYDLCIRASEVISLKKLVSLMKYLGYKGVGIPSMVLNQNDSSNFLIDVVSTSELKNVHSAKLNSMINKSYKESECVIAVGDTEKVNRSIVENPHVDILSLPLDSKCCILDHVVAKFAAYRGIALEFDVGCMIRYRGGKRVLAINELKQRLMLARKFKLNLVLTSGAQSIYDLRSPQDLIALSYLVGMTKNEAIHAMTDYPKNLLHKKRNPNYIMEGVEVIDRIIEEI